jgi:hypothetical protein
MPVADPEIRAMSTIVAVLDKLDDDQRCRVLRWLLDRYDVDSPAWRAHAAVQQSGERQAANDHDRIERVIAAHKRDLGTSIGGES